MSASSTRRELMGQMAILTGGAAAVLTGCGSTTEATPTPTTLEPAQSRAVTDFSERTAITALYSRVDYQTGDIISPENLLAKHQARKLSHAKMPDVFQTPFVRWLVESVEAPSFEEVLQRLQTVDAAEGNHVAGYVRGILDARSPAAAAMVIAEQGAAHRKVEPWYQVRGAAQREVLYAHQLSADEFIELMDAYVEIPEADRQRVLNGDERAMLRELVERCKAGMQETGDPLSVVRAYADVIPPGKSSDSEILAGDHAALWAESKYYL